MRQAETPNKECKSPSVLLRQTDFLGFQYTARKKLSSEKVTSSRSHNVVCKIRVPLCTKPKARCLNPVRHSEKQLQHNIIERTPRRLHDTLATRSTNQQLNDKAPTMYTTRQEPRASNLVKLRLLATHETHSWLKHPVGLADFRISTDPSASKQKLHASKRHVHH